MPLINPDVTFSSPECGAGVSLLAVVEDRIKLYRLFLRNNDGRPGPLHRRAALTPLAAAVRALASAFDALDFETRNDLEKIAGAKALDPNETPFNESPLPDEQARGRSRLMQIRNSAAYLQEWSKEALASLSQAKSGPKPNDALLWLAEQLAYVYIAHTGRTVDWSENAYSFEHFAQTVIEIADNDVGAGQLELALRAARKAVAVKPQEELRPVPGDDST